MDNKNIIINKIIILLYFVVAFIPIMGAVDIVNTQWFYIAITNVISLSYIFFNRQKYNLNTTTKLTASIFIGSFIFFLVSILSITKSLVISESIISLMYFVLTMVALWVFYFTIKQNPKKYFDFFAIIIAIFGFIESFQVFNYFNTHTHQIRSNELLEALKHNYGNRNILAISIIMKLPFLIYLYFKKKKIIKITALIGLLMFCIAVLLIGARTAIYGGFIILIALIIYKLFLINSLKNKIKHVIPLLIIPLLSLLISLNLNKIQKNKLNSFVDLTFTQSKKSLISINNSLTTINLLNDSGRGKIWQTAIEDIKRSPFLGIGIGNWKLMPKKGFTEKRKSKSYSYIKRVHNDFLQVFAEVGVFGFIIYLSFYMFVFTLLLKRIITNIKNQNREEAFYSIILFASFSIYFLDAFFNFPHERTPIQIFMFFILAIILAFSPKKEIVNIKTIPIFIFIFLLSLGGLIVGFKSYKASRVYKILYSDFEGKDIFKGKSKIPYNKVLKILPEFPEIDNRVRSIHLLKSFYAYNDNKKDKAIKHVSDAIKMTPHRAEPLGYKAMFYARNDKLLNKDSAFYYAKKAFDIQPSVPLVFRILVQKYIEDKDTLNVIKTFNTYTKLAPKDVNAWIHKAEYLYIYKKEYNRFLDIIDSSYALNPKNKKIKEYREKQLRIKKN